MYCTRYMCNVHVHLLIIIILLYSPVHVQVSSLQELVKSESVLKLADQESASKLEQGLSQATHTYMYMYVIHVQCNL